MGIVWGFVAALGWGSADFLARGVSQRLTPYRALLYAHLVSFGCLLVLVLLNPPQSWTFGMLALGAVLGTTNTLASLMIYRALAVGRIAIVSPICSAFAAITLALSLLTGDAISVAKVFGLLLTVVGVVLASMPAAAAHERSAPASRGVPEALAAALLFGFTFWGLKFVVPTLGPWLPVLESRIITITLLPLLALPLGQSVAPPPRALWSRVAVIGMIDTVANAAYNAGVRSDAPGVVAVLGSLFSPVTVVLAFIILRERLSARQWVGVALIFVAVAAIGVAENFAA